MIAASLIAGFLPFFSILGQVQEGEQRKSFREKSSHIEYKNLLAVIEQQLQALRSGKIDNAYKRYTSKEFQNETSLEQFARLTQWFTVLSQNRLFQPQSFYYEDGIATFGGDLISTDGKLMSVEYNLIEESGVWKILGLQIYQIEFTIPPQR